MIDSSPLGIIKGVAGESAGIYRVIQGLRGVPKVLVHGRRDHWKYSSLGRPQTKTETCCLDFRLNNCQMLADGV